MRADRALNEDWGVNLAKCGQTSGRCEPIEAFRRESKRGERLQDCIGLLAIFHSVAHLYHIEFIERDVCPFNRVSDRFISFLRLRLSLSLS